MKHLGLIARKLRVTYFKLLRINAKAVETERGGNGATVRVGNDSICHILVYNCKRGLMRRFTTLVKLCLITIYFIYVYSLDYQECTHLYIHEEARSRTCKGRSVQQPIRQAASLLANVIVS